jgi:hypothetical protein
MDFVARFNGIRCADSLAQWISLMEGLGGLVVVGVSISMCHGSGDPKKTQSKNLDSQIDASSQADHFG